MNTTEITTWDELQDAICAFLPARGGLSEREVVDAFAGARFNELAVAKALGELRRDRRAYTITTKDARGQWTQRFVRLARQRGLF